MLRLKAAVTGELTREWRETNKAKLEPASQLLKRILKERRKKWEEQQLEQFKAKGLPAPKDGIWWLYVIRCENNSFYTG
jgi:type I restriction enzyme S subunit